MTPEMLRRVGETLYGPHWQPELARVLNISPRNVRRWLSGYHAINAGVAEALAELCEAQSGELVELARTLRAQAKAAERATASAATRLREE